MWNHPILKTGSDIFKALYKAQTEHLCSRTMGCCFNTSAPGDGIHSLYFYFLVEIIAIIILS